jgi:hypothetical protein
MISEAVKVAYAAHQKLQPGRKTERDLVGAVRKYIEESRGRFIDTRAGLRRMSDSELESSLGVIAESQRMKRAFVFAPGHFHKMFRTEDDAEPTLQRLKAAGFLKHDAGKLTTKWQVRSNRYRERVYCICESILGHSAT